MGGTEWDVRCPRVLAAVAARVAMFGALLLQGGGLLINEIGGGCYCFIQYNVAGQKQVGYRWL